MRAIQRHLMFLCASLFLFLAPGCGESDPLYIAPDSGMNPPTPDTSPDPGSDTRARDAYQLVIIGPDLLQLQVGQQTVLKVQYTRNGQAVSNEPISFAFKGDAKDSMVSNVTAVTDLQGYAQTIVSAGQALTTFQLEATAYQALPVLWSIQITAAPEPPTPQLAGTLSLTSSFNIQTDFTGTELSEALNLINAITNDPDDPGKFVVDLIFDNLNQDIAKIANIFRPILYTPVNSLLMSIAPELISETKSLGANLSAMARTFTITSQMTSANPQPGDRKMVVSHRLNSIVWTINGQKEEYSFSSYSTSTPQVDGLGLVLDEKMELSIPEHAFEIQFGAFLLAGLNTLVIPQINPQAHSFSDLLMGWIDCRQVGMKINSTVNILGEAFWEGACKVGINALSGYFEQAILKIDQDTSSLMLNGRCILTDGNNDLYYDTMSNGTWSGTFNLNQNIAPLDPAKNTFVGSRTH